MLIQTIANSIYAQNTLIFVIEDDSQDSATTSIPTAPSPLWLAPT